MEFILAMLNPELEGDFKELLQCEAGDKEQYVVLLREAAEKLEYPEVDGKDLLDQMNERMSNSSSTSARSPLGMRSSSESTVGTNITPKQATLSGRNLNGSSVTASASSDSFVRSPPAAAPPQSPVRAAPVVDPIESRTYILLAYDKKEETKLYDCHRRNISFCFFGIFNCLLLYPRLLYFRQMLKKGIKMSWDPSVKLWYLCGDAGKIEEVIGSEQGKLVQVENPHL